MRRWTSYTRLVDSRNPTSYIHIAEMVQNSIRYSTDTCAAGPTLELLSKLGLRTVPYTVHWQLHGAVWRLRYPYRQDLEACLNGTVYGTDLCRMDRQMTAVTAVHTVIRHFWVSNLTWVPKIEMLTYFDHTDQAINKDNGDNDASTSTTASSLVSYFPYNTVCFY